MSGTRAPKKKAARKPAAARREVERSFQKSQCRNSKAVPDQDSDDSNEVDDKDRNSKEVPGKAPDSKEVQNKGRNYHISAEQVARLNSEKATRGPKATVK